MYGDARLASLIGGSGGRGTADSGGGGAGAFGLEANGTGDITIGSTGVLGAEVGIRSRCRCGWFDLPER